MSLRVALALVGYAMAFTMAAVFAITLWRLPRWEQPESSDR